MKRSRRVSVGLPPALSASLCAAGCALVLIACGGRQTPPPAAEGPVRVPLAEQPECLPPRWEAPPAQMGQTPPDVPAPASFLESLELEGSGDADAPEP